MTKVQFDTPDGEAWADLPDVPRMGEDVEPTPDAPLLKVVRVVWTPGDPGQDVIVICR
jgi:hypothetical protein